MQNTFTRFYATNLHFFRAITEKLYNPWKVRISRNTRLIEQAAFKLFYLLRITRRDTSAAVSKLFSCRVIEPIKENFPQQFETLYCSALEGMYHFYTNKAVYSSDNFLTAFYWTSQSRKYNEKMFLVNLLLSIIFWQFELHLRREQRDVNPLVADWILH